MVRSSTFVTCAGMFFLTIAPGVSADPIHVTGVMNITREVGMGDRVYLSGPGFAFDARVGHLDGYVGPFTCNPCMPGSIIDAGGVLSTTVFGDGTLTLNGVTYPVTESLDSPATLYMTLSGFLLAPNFAGLSTSVTVPFTMLSQVLIAGVQQATISGGGSATVFFDPIRLFLGMDRCGRRRASATTSRTQRPYPNRRRSCWWAAALPQRRMQSDGGGPKTLRPLTPRTPSSCLHLSDSRPAWSGG